MKAKALLQSLELPLAVVERSSTLSLLQHIRFADGRALATNFHASVEVDVEMKTECCVPAKRLSDALGAIAMYAGDAEVKAKLNGAVLELRAGRSRYTMPTLAATDYPLPAWPASTEPLKEWAALVPAIDFVRPFAAAESDERKFLRGVALQGKDVVASNGYSAAVARDEGAPGHDLIIPAPTLAVVAALPAVSAFARTESALTLVFERGRMNIQLIAGRFPDMRRFVPEKHEGDVATVEHDALKRACGALRKTREASYLRVSLAADRLTLEDETATAASRVELEVAYRGREWTTGINLDYLTAAVDGLAGPHIQLSQKEDGSPMLFTGGKASRAVVIMGAKI